MKKRKLVLFSTMIAGIALAAASGARAGEPVAGRRTRTVTVGGVRVLTATQGVKGASNGWAGRATADLPGEGTRIDGSLGRIARKSDRLVGNLNLEFGAEDDKDDPGHLSSSAGANVNLVSATPGTLRLLQGSAGWNRELPHGGRLFLGGGITPILGGVVKDRKSGKVAFQMAHVLGKAEHVISLDDFNASRVAFSGALEAGLLLGGQYDGRPAGEWGYQAAGRLGVEYRVLRFHVGAEGNLEKTQINSRAEKGAATDSEGAPAKAGTLGGGGMLTIGGFF